MYRLASQVVLVVKNLPANAGPIRDTDLIPGWGRSPKGGYGNLLQYSCLENPMDRGPGRLQSIGSYRVRHNQSYLAQHTGIFICCKPHMIRKVKLSTQG